MQKTLSGILYSATDLVNFLECEHLTVLDLQNLETPLPKTEDDEQAKLIQDKGFAHEAAYVNKLREQHASFIDIAAVGNDRTARHQATLQAMQDGIEIIFQATFLKDEFLGYADPMCALWLTRNLPSKDDTTPLPNISNLIWFGLVVILFIICLLVLFPVPQI